MNNKAKLVIVSLLAGLILVSCNFSTLLSAQQDDLGASAPTNTQTIQASPSETPEPEPQPTTQADTIQLIDRRVFEDGDEPRYEVDGVWPNLKGPETHVASFNTESDRLTESIKEDFLLVVTDEPGAMVGEGEAPLSYLTFNYDLTYSDQQLFSVYLAFDQYIAMSAHPFPFSHALNYDAHGGALLRLEDLFLPGTDYINEIGSLLDPVLVGKELGYQVGTAADVMLERENWNLLAEGLRINFDVYEVGPYAAGPQNVLIPWIDLAGMIDPNGPAARFID